MITMLGSRRRSCDGITRRESLRAGALALGAGFGLPELLRAEEASGRSASGEAKSVIVLYLLGGAATQDMWDIKPDAPDGIRSEFKPVPTSAPGVSIGEHLPNLARWMHRGAIVRTMRHKGGCHNPLPSYTGDERFLTDLLNPNPAHPPSMGSVCEYLGGGPAGVPAYMYLPCYLGWGQAIRRPGPYAGFLGARYDPLFAECDPHIDPGGPKEQLYEPRPLLGTPRIAGVDPAPGLTIDRIGDRRSLLQQFDDGLRRQESAGVPETFDRQRRRAYDLLTSSRVRAAFQLEREDPRLRDRYGRTLFGSSLLIARRLVEAGVRFVNATWDCYWERLGLAFACWDTHWHNFKILREHNLPLFDRSASALLEDLHARGLLDETLVVVMSEMGRAPKLNPSAGRDHWTECYSVVLFGAGIRGGTVHGASDAHAAYVKDHPTRPADLCATVYHALGIDPDLTVTDQAGRPMPIAQGGEPIRPILA